jgi:SPOR domain
MQKVKIRPADFPMTAAKSRFDLPVVLSLAGLVSVVAVIGAAAFQSGFFSEGARYITTMFTSSDMVTRTVDTNFSNEISRLNKKLAEVSKQLQFLSQAQIKTSGRIEEIEEAFTSTASISAAAVGSSSPYYRILETGWDADDMVTRRQKRDRIALLKIDDVSVRKNLNGRDNTVFQARYAVELNSYENIITARKQWQKLSKKYAPLLTKLEPYLLPALGTKNQKSRVKLIVGPIKTAAKAAQICSTLRSNGQSCQERVFSTSNITVVSAPENRLIKSP